MTSYGFVIDNRKCIGCHACSTACKSENEVPLGVNRTWVKYVEKGEFPHTRRFFQVTRCNHCLNPPCVAICPVTAMYQRKDGIVEFDPNLCIGCKACMQACPYDAIYLDPDSQTAAKCHYCAHRTDLGLEPACVVVCPEHAIIAGDLDDPGSEISKLVSREQVRVRKPEQGTLPKLFYIDAEEGAIVPTAAIHDQAYMWASQNPTLHGGGAIHITEGSMAQTMVRATYDVSHARPWGWQVPSYLVTKSIGAGMFMVPGLALAMGWLTANRTLTLVFSLLALVFMGMTTGLLVWDLGRPERFVRVALRPQLRSWLARGAYFLMGFSLVGGLFWLAELLGIAGVPEILLWPGLILAGLSAIYTAFLFGQCEGRDLWQTPLLPPHLLAQAVMAGGAGLALIPAALGGSAQSLGVASLALAAGLGLHLIMILGEFAMPHTTDNARHAAHLITHGPFRALFWGVAVILGGLLPVSLLIFGWGSATLLSLASILALLGLLAFEWCFVMAGQSVPNS